ncbi:transposase, partial [Enterococcus faecium]|uniref:transposase n=1 Tax=Enterococcus faecium TaxID=1352 RepID=UPI0034E9893B
RTFKKFLPQIQNALHYSYSNGPLECLNNHIKVLKRNAYGFRKVKSIILCKILYNVLPVSH